MINSQKKESEIGMYIGYLLGQSEVPEQRFDTFGEALDWAFGNFDKLPQVKFDRGDEDC